MICISIKPTSYEQLYEQFSCAQRQGDLVEIRVDALPSIDCNQLKNFLSQRKVPLLLTLRSKTHGGEWKGSLKEKENLLLALTKLSPNYLDLEYPQCELFISMLRRIAPEMKLLLSHHNSVETPKNLACTLKEMQALKCDLYKIVTTAHSTLDALRVLLFSREAGKNVIALAMGKAGEVTRIAAPLVGTPWIYASLSENEGTAPGQLTASSLRNCYHCDSLGVDTQLCGLLGDPVKHSIGHIAHNAVYYQLGINALYVRMCVRKEELKKCLLLLEQLGARGCSVTIPLKEKVQPFLYKIDPKAKAIGAVNTLTFFDDGIFGSNTDAVGALEAIEEHALLSGARVAMIGAGGSARAIAYEAKSRGASVVVFALRVEQAKMLAADLEVEGRVLSDLEGEEYDVLVNCTPSESPIDEQWIRPHTLVMDLKVEPRCTQFLRAAAKRGCRCVYGREMFVQQALGQLQAWFGEKFEKKQIQELFRKATNLP